MKKLMIPMAGVAAMVFSLFAGCSDSSPVANNNNTMSPRDESPYQATTIKEDIFKDFREIPELDDQVLLKDNPSASVDMSHFSTVTLYNYWTIVQQLNLSAQQDSAIRLCFMSYNQCSMSAAGGYASARRALAEEMVMAMKSIETQIKRGLVSRQEGLKLRQELVASYQMKVQALNDQAQRGSVSCRINFEACVASHLTVQQREMWERLKGSPTTVGTRKI